MGLKDICTTQETSRKLKEAGFPQEGGIAYWVNTKKGWEFLGSSQLIIMFDDYFRAFTFNELWDWLPPLIRTKYHKYNLNLVKHESIIPKDISKIFYDPYKANQIKRTEPNKPIQDSAAELALWCVKEGYLNPKEDNNG